MFRLYMKLASLDQKVFDMQETARLWPTWQAKPIWNFKELHPGTEARLESIASARAREEDTRCRCIITLRLT
jgi:hypothetical protein